MAAINRNVTIDPTTGHRIDPLTKIDLDQAIANRDNLALTQVEVAQLEAMLEEFPGSWYVEHSLTIARRRLAKYAGINQHGVGSHGRQ